jgi:hypothetical protein
MKFFAPNGRVAVEPIPQTARTEAKHGIIAPMNQAGIVPVKVLFDSDEFEANTTVYVRTRINTTTTYGKEIFEAEGKRFILIPKDEVVLGSWNNEPAEAL